MQQGWCPLLPVASRYRRKESLQKAYSVSVQFCVPRNTVLAKCGSLEQVRCCITESCAVAAKPEKSLEHE
eukprot:5880998-Amphidinium_carterae.2